MKREGEAEPGREMGHGMKGSGGDHQLTVDDVEFAALFDVGPAQASTFLEPIAQVEADAALIHGGDAREQGPQAFLPGTLAHLIQQQPAQTLAGGFELGSRQDASGAAEGSWKWKPLLHPQPHRTNCCNDKEISPANAGLTRREGRPSVGEVLG